MYILSNRVVDSESKCWLNALSSVSQHTLIGDVIVSLAPGGWGQLGLLCGISIKKAISIRNLNFFFFINHSFGQKLGEFT